MISHGWVPWNHQFLRVVDFLKRLFPAQIVLVDDSIEVEMIADGENIFGLGRLYNIGRFNFINEYLEASGVFHHTSGRAQLQGTRKSWFRPTSPVAQNIKIEALANDRLLDTERISLCSERISERTSGLDSL